MLSPCVVNGSLVPEACVPVDSIPFTYGFGVYENLRVRNRVLCFPEQHMARLLRSAAVIGLAPKRSEEIHAWLGLLVRAIPEESFNVKILLVGEDCYLFASRPHYLPDKAYRDGVTAITVRAERQFLQAKTLSMLSSYLAYREAQAAGAYDALLVDREGFVTEGTRANLFYTDGETMFTPPDALEGVTRQLVIAALCERGVRVAERKLHERELAAHQGYFLTSTGAGVVPLRAIGATQVGIPSITRQAMECYAEVLDAHVLVSQRIPDS